MKVLSVLILAVLSPAFAKNFGGINVAGVGTIYVVGPDWASGNVQMNGNGGFTLNGGGRVYFATSPTDGWDKNMFWKVCS